MRVAASLPAFVSPHIVQVLKQPSWEAPQSAGLLCALPPARTMGKKFAAFLWWHLGDELRGGIVSPKTMPLMHNRGATAEQSGADFFCWLQLSVLSTGAQFVPACVNPTAEMTQLLARREPGEIFPPAWLCTWRRQRPWGGRGDVPLLRRFAAVNYKLRLKQSWSPPAWLSPGCLDTELACPDPCQVERSRQELLIYCAGWQWVKCNDLRQHFCHCRRRAIKPNEMCIVPWH